MFELLALDIGNTRIHWLALDKRGDFSCGAQNFDSQQLPDAVAELCRAKLKAVVAVSVRPEVDEVLRKQLSQLGHKLQIIGQDFAYTIENAVAAPEQVGLDRLMLAQCAADRFPGQPALALGLGTALTVNRVSANGAFIGGSIGCGLGLQLRALAQHASLLPQVKILEAPIRCGQTTVEAIQSGTYWSFIDTLRGIIDYYRSQHPKLKVLIAGGDADLVRSSLDRDAVYEPNAVLLGLCSSFNNQEFTNGE